MSNKLLTILIMTYNRPDYLSECLDSIEKQTFKNFNLIVSDNGSSKDYSKVLSKFKNLNIKYVKHEGNNDRQLTILGIVLEKINTKYNDFS